MLPKLGANAAGSCQMFIRNIDSCKMGHLPNSSLHGAQSSQPNEYITRYTHCPTRAACSLTPKWSAMGVTAFGKTEVLKFMEI